MGDLLFSLVVVATLALVCSSNPLLDSTETVVVSGVSVLFLLGSA